MSSKDGDKPEDVEDAEILGDEDAETPVDLLLADDEEDDEDPSEKGNLFVAEDEEHAAEPVDLPKATKSAVSDEASGAKPEIEEDLSAIAPDAADTAKEPEFSEAKSDLGAGASDEDEEQSGTDPVASKVDDEGAQPGNKADASNTKNPDDTAESDEGDVAKDEGDADVEASSGEEVPEAQIVPETAPEPEKDPEPQVVDREAPSPEPEPETRKIPDTAATLLSSTALNQSGGIAQEPEEDHEEEEYFEEEEELHQSTFLRKLGLSAGLLVAGALVALWLGPKIAPGLPSGMGGVRDWLMPGQSEAQVQIEALRNDLERRIAVLPRQRTEAEIAAIVAGSVAANRTDYEARIAALEARVEELIDIGSRADASGFEPRIATLENRVSGVAAQIKSLNDTLTSFESDGSVSETAIAQMAGFTSNVEAVRAEVAGLVDLTATLEQEMAEVRSSAERRVQDAESEIASAQEQAAKAEKAANIDAGLNAIEAAIVSGGPFVDAITQLEPHAEIPLTLTLASEEGVATVAELQDGFTQAAHKAIRASIQADADDSVLGRMGAFLSGQVANRSLTPQEGDTTDAILSRAEAAVRLGDMKTTAAEISTLSPEASNGMADWADLLVQRVDVEVDFEQLRDQLQTTN